MATPSEETRLPPKNIPVPMSYVSSCSLLARWFLGLQKLQNSPKRTFKKGSAGSFQRKTLQLLNEYPTELLPKLLALTLSNRWQKNKPVLPCHMYPPCNSHVFPKNLLRLFSSGRQDVIGSVRVGLTILGKLTSAIRASLAGTPSYSYCRYLCFQASGEVGQSYRQSRLPSSSAYKKKQPTPKRSWPTSVKTLGAPQNIRAPA